MSNQSTSVSGLYLSKEHGELVIREGSNTNQSKHVDKRVLVVGGGVTGLTASIFAAR